MSICINVAISIIHNRYWWWVEPTSILNLSSSLSCMALLAGRWDGVRTFLKACCSTHHDDSTYSYHINMEILILIMTGNDCLTGGRIRIGRAYLQSKGKWKGKRAAVSYRYLCMLNFHFSYMVNDQPPTSTIELVIAYTVSMWEQRNSVWVKIKTKNASTNTIN